MFLVFASLVIFSSLPFAQPRLENSRKDREATIQREILRLEELGRKKALKGETQWDDLMADGAYLIQWDGSVRVYSKGQELPSIPLKSFRMSDMIVRVYGDAAVVTGLSDVESVGPDKKPFSYQMRFLNVWKKSEGSWKIVVAERTSVKQPTR